MKIIFILYYLGTPLNYNEPFHVEVQFKTMEACLEGKERILNSWVEKYGEAIKVKPEKEMNCIELKV